MGRERTEGERRASEEFADVVRMQAERFFEAMLEEMRRNPEALRRQPASLTEEEADELAIAAVRRTRSDSVRRTDDHPPSEAEIADWVEEREAERESRPKVWKPTNPR